MKEFIIVVFCGVVDLGKIYLVKLVVKLLESYGVCSVYFGLDIFLMDWIMWKKRGISGYDFRVYDIG